MAGLEKADKPTNGPLRKQFSKQQYTSEIYGALRDNLNTIDALLDISKMVREKGDIDTAKKLLDVAEEVINTNKQIEKVVRSGLSELN